ACEFGRKPAGVRTERLRPRRGAYILDASAAYTSVMEREDSLAEPASERRLRSSTECRVRGDLGAGRQAAKQVERDAPPLEVERVGRDRLTGAFVPVGGVAEIAFLAMQVRMHPGGVRILDVLGEMMRSVPFAARIVPQRAHERRKLADVRRRSQFVNGHRNTIGRSVEIDVAQEFQPSDRSRRTTSLGE